MFYEVLMEKRAARHRNAELEKVAILSFLPWNTIKMNAERKHIASLPPLLALKGPWAASKAINRGAAKRLGATNAGKRSLLQTGIEDYLIAPEAADITQGVGLLQDAAMRAKIKMNPFMHKPEDIGSLNSALKSGKKNMLQMRDRIKELRAQGLEGTPEYRALIAGRREAAGTFKNNLRELRREQLVGDIPMDNIMEELQEAGLDLARKKGYGTHQASAAAGLGRAMLQDQLEAAGVDANKMNLRQVQDRLAQWADETRTARHEAADAKRSDFGKAIAGFTRKFYDPTTTNWEMGGRFLGSMQLDDVYDPIAKRRSTADGLLSSLATNVASRGGRIAYAPAEALDARYGKKAGELVDKVREGVLEWDPKETAASVAKKLRGSGDVPADVPALPAPTRLPPALNTPKPRSKDNLRKMQRRSRRKNRKKR
jgi:hypothetical protein